LIVRLTASISAERSVNQIGRLFVVLAGRREERPASSEISIYVEGRACIISMARHSTSFV